MAATFNDIALRYKQGVDIGKRAWAVASVDPTNDQELRQATIALQKLRAEIAEHEVNVERSDAGLTQAGIAVIMSIAGLHPTDSNRTALLLTQAEKEKLVSEIVKVCHNECRAAAGVKYAYAAVGLMLEKLRELWALDGIPMQPKK